MPVRARHRQARTDRRHRRRRRAQADQPAQRPGVQADPGRDREGRIRVWNGGAETLFGHAAAQALGQSLDLIIPERFRAAHWNAFDAALAAGRVAHPGEVRTTRAVHQDGSKVYVEMSFGVVCDGQGAAIGSIALARPRRSQADAPAAGAARQS
ncbi:MAG: PAS domain S-box protein [Burkholderiales bacterium]|nr:PAS domain S-box protein [Burkholderiales bacterium]